MNTKIEINDKQNNSTDNISVKGIDKEKSNKRKHISKFLEGNVRKNRSTTENKKISYNVTLDPMKEKMLKQMKYIVKRK